MPKNCLLAYISIKFKKQLSNPPFLDHTHLPFSFLPPFYRNFLTSKLLYIFMYAREKVSCNGVCKRIFFMVFGAFGVSTMHLQIILIKFLKMILKITNATWTFWPHSHLSVVIKNIKCLRKLLTLVQKV